jgi:hypothetical protein
MDAPINYEPKSPSLPRTSMWSAKEFVVDRTPYTFKIKGPPIIKENPSKTTKLHDEPKQSVSATIQELKNQVQTILARIEGLRQLSSTNSSETPSTPDHARNPDKLPPPSFSNHSYKNYLSFKEILVDFMPVERINLEMESTSMQIISKEERVCLIPTDKAKIHATFIKGINNKLRRSNTILGMGEVTTIANVISFSQL